MNIHEVRSCPAIGLMLAVATAMAAPVVCSMPLVLEQNTRIVSPDPNYRFAGPVAISGNRIVIGATRSEAGQFRSAAFLFERASANAAWKYVTKLVEVGPVQDFENFLSVAIADNVAAVAVANAAYVFEPGAAGWIRTATLAKPAGALDFGSDVAIGAGYVAVGGNASEGVAAYLYQKNAAGQWSENGRLIGGPTANEDDVIGPQLGIADNVLIIGSAPTSDPQVPGVAHVFELTGGVWIPGGRLQGVSPLPADNIASIVDVGGFVAAINDAPVSSVTLYHQEDPGDWWLDGTLQPPDAFLNDRQLSVAGGRNAGFHPRFAIGVPSDEDRSPAAGSITIYERQPGGVDSPFFRVAKLLSSDARKNQGLGGHVAISGRTVVGSADGAAYVYELPNDLTEPALIQDDFEDGNSAGWDVRSSVWSVVSSGGSRVYRQTSAAGDARSVLSNTDWRNQAIQADVRPLSFNGTDRWFGLLARYVDDNNFYYITLRNTNRIDLRRSINGVFGTLASAPLAVTPNRSYRVRLEAIGAWLRVYVDGALLIQKYDRSLLHGTVGMRMYQATAQYDNVVVSPHPLVKLYADNFEDGDSVNWTTFPDNAWSVVSSNTRVFRQNSTTGAARAITGISNATLDYEPPDQIVEASARALNFAGGGDRWFGLAARFIDDANYYYVTVRNTNVISLRKLTGSAINVLDSAPMTVTSGTWYRLRLEAIGDLLRVYVNGRLTLEARDPMPFDRGRYGVVMFKTMAEYDNVVVTQP